jgi:hypothetical protein
MLLRSRASAEQLKEKLRQDLIRKYNVYRLYGRRAARIIFLCETVDLADGATKPF